MAMPGNDSDLLLLFLLLQSVSDEDDPFLGEMLYERIRDRLKRSEFFDPEIDHLLRRKLRYPQKSRSRRLSESRDIATSVLEGFRRSFEESTNQKIDGLEKLIHKIEERTQSLQSDLSKHKSEAALFRRTAQDYLWLLGAGIDITKVEVNRYIPVRVYLSDPVPERNILNQLSDSIAQILEDTGFERSDEFPEEKGSWWKRFVFRTKDAVTNKEVTDRVKKGERAIEIAVLDKPQAEANLCQAQAASALISSLANTANACIQAGSLLVVKATNNNNESSIITRTLTPMELKHLEENQAVLRKPEEILDWLQGVEKKRLTNTSIGQ
ncbi:MAG: hypothetical protein LAT65_19090 [Saccharospirillum sp.]|nr:hypothetical protein [Saccharospirillum sp.]